MPEFLKYVLELLRNSLILVLLGAVAAAAVLFLANWLHKRKHGGERPFPWKKSILCIAMVGYLFIVLYATLLRMAGGFRQYNFHLFRAWLDAWNHFSVKSFANLLLNIAMFLPLGLLLPLLDARLRRWHYVTITGFSLSLAIEMIQLAACRGVWDIDDLFCNTLGALIGYWIIMTILMLYTPANRKKSIRYGILSLASLLTISSLFLLYHTQEYGNLPNSPSYTNPTADVQWTLACQLPAGDNNAPIYQNQPRSKQDCDVFAEAFREIVTAEYNTISYYEEAAYYMDNSIDGGAHFLFVNYSDQGYTYSGLYETELPWLEGDRKTLEKALEEFPVEIPESAAFQSEDQGWYRFSVELFVDGDRMLDGTLRVRCTQDGAVCDIENDLLSYTYYDTVKILSPEEAYRQLCAGRFNDEGRFEWVKPKQLTVISCALGYAIDTKGFYQPVYYFEVVSPDNAYHCQILIPAMQ